VLLESVVPYHLPGGRKELPLSVKLSLHKIPAEEITTPFLFPAIFK